jgi:hypothetical protein
MNERTWGPFSGRQLTTMVVALILVLGVPGTVWAVDTFSNVAIEDPVTGVKASVDSSKRLKVGDGSSAMTVDGTTTGPEAAANTLFRSATFPTSSGNCTPIATPPANKALIIKSVALNTYSVTSPGSGRTGVFYLGTDGCEVIVFDINPPGVGLINQPFEPGLGVPAGKRLWVSTNNISAEVYTFGYSVPASAVPASSFSGSAKGSLPPQR